MEKIKLIKAMMKAGRAKDLLTFVEGESPYLTDASEGVSNALELRRNWILVVHHLRFVSIFGHEKSPQQWSGKILASYPSDFEFWLDAGAPGIAEVDLHAYLADYPL
ncbi:MULTISPECIES: hypothetical protein [Pseudomonas]|uniref:hypothetical protein n=1 Tax=Pseudomonas TaxID=286 RepID=UPI000B84D6C6|nr:hypothetical protein [Pseudomonas sp. NFACC25]